MRRNQLREAVVAALPRPMWDSLESRILFAAFMDLIGVTALRNDPAFAGIDGSGVSVAVIDTGVDINHPDLAPNMVAGGDFIFGGNDPTPVDPHGTHVAGTVGAVDPEIGVAPDVGLIGLQVFTPTQNGVGAYDTDTEAALRWVIDNRAQFNIVAVNMSLGSGNFQNSNVNSIYRDEIAQLEAIGVTVVSAAGNDYARFGVAGAATPAIHSTIAVGAVYEEDEGRVSLGGTDFTTGPDRITSFSQRPNTSNVLFAPGAKIFSTLPNNSYGLLSGTSMASPVVAGVVALLQETALQYGGRLLTPTEVRSILQQTADIINDGDDEDTSVNPTGDNYPRVNAHRAAQSVVQLFGGSTPGTTDPNGTIATAAFGGTLDGQDIDALNGVLGTDGSTAVAQDVDLVRIEVRAPGSVSITAAAVGGSDPFLRIFDSAGTQLGSDDDSATGLGANVVLNLLPGTYYAGISSAGNTAYNPTVAGSGSGATSSGSYTLSFEVTSVDPDGLIANAVALSLTGETQIIGGDIGEDFGASIGVSDVDFYRIVIPDNGTLLVDIDTPTGSGFVDSYMRFFDVNGNELTFSDDDFAFDGLGDPTEFAGPGATAVDGQGAFIGHVTDSFVGGTVVKGVEYYVGISSFDNRTYDPTTLAGRQTSGTGGTYNLNVTFFNNDLNGSIDQVAAFAATGLPWVFEENIGFDDTTEVGDKDVDFARVNSPTAGILELDMDSFGDADINFPVDSVLRLFDEDGNLLAENDDTDGRDPFLRYEIEANTDYYVAVTGYGNDGFDPFVLASGSAGDTGDYILYGELLPLSSSTSFSNDSSDAGVVLDLNINTSLDENIGEDSGFVRGSDDVDIYRFFAPFTGEFSISADGVGDFPADAFLRVFTDTGTQLGSNGDGLSSVNGSVVTLNLTGGQTYLVGVSGKGPSQSSYNPLTGVGAGAGDTGDYSILVESSLASIAFGGKTKAVYTDSNGTRVTVSMKGPGSGTVFLPQGGGDAVQIVTSGSTTASTLNIKGDTTVGGFVVQSLLKAISAKTADLVGDIDAPANVSTLTFRNINGANLDIAGDVTITAASVADSSITASGTIRSLKVANWLDAATPRDVITAGAIGSITSKTAFGADIRTASLTKLKVARTLADASIRVTGNIGTITVQSVSDSEIYAGVDDAVTALPGLSSDFDNPGSFMTAFVVTSKVIGAFSNTRIAAGTINKLALGGVRTDNLGTEFGVAADTINNITATLDGIDAGPFKDSNLTAVEFVSGDFLLRVF